MRLGRRPRVDKKQANGAGIRPLGGVTIVSIGHWEVWRGVNLRSKMLVFAFQDAGTGRREKIKMQQVDPGRR